MNKTLWAIDKLFTKKVARETRQHLAEVAAASRRGARARAEAMLSGLAWREGPHVTLGRTQCGEPVRVPLAYLVSAHSIMTGGTGSGKTMAALAIVEAILEADDPPASFG